MLRGGATDLQSWVAAVSSPVGFHKWYNQGALKNLWTLNFLSGQQDQNLYLFSIQLWRDPIGKNWLIEEFSFMRYSISATFWLVKM